VIVSIAEQNYRLASPNWLQHVAGDVHERVVKHRAGEFTDLRLLDSGFKLLAIAGQRAELLHLPIESDNHGSILRAQLFQKLFCRFLDVVQDAAGAKAGVQHEHDVQGLFAGIEKRNLLFDLIVKKAKGLLSDPGHSDYRDR
jgi:hypothetical protein